MIDYKKNEVLLTVDNIWLAFGPDGVVTEANFVKTKDKKVILRNVNFKIHNITRPGQHQGQVVSLIGRSGIGKTQLFLMLSGLLKSTYGKILIDQVQKPVEAGDMGVIFQNYPLFIHRTIESNLHLAATKNPKFDPKEIKDIVRSQADKFELHDHLQKYPAQLSGGQRQRVAIVQQLLNGGNFILMDEPFSGLDCIVLEKVVERVRQVSQEDDLKTIVLVSHDIETSVALSDMVVVLGNEPNIEGATVRKEIDLLERDLAWDPRIKEKPAFHEVIREIKSYL